MSESPATRARAVMGDANRLLGGFYTGVALAALAGQALAAQEWLGWPLLLTTPAVGLVELGGIALCAFADARRRLGERAWGARVASAAVAVGAVLLNWTGHPSHLAGGFFAGLSALGYLVWLLQSGARRRDQRQGDGDMAATPPSYELWGHWFRHPGLTRRARSMAKADPSLGLYGSLDAAREAIQREARNAALTKALRRRVADAADPTLAEIAVHTYDLDQIAERLRDGADYDGVTSILAGELAAERIAPVVGATSASRGASGKRSGAPRSAATGAKPGRQQSKASAAGARQPGATSATTERQADGGSGAMGAPVSATAGANVFAISDGAERHERARRYYLDAISAGQTVNASAMGRALGMSTAWGRMTAKRIERELKEGRLAPRQALTPQRLAPAVAPPDEAPSASTGATGDGSERTG
jgi:hypothetical protein